MHGSAATRLVKLNALDVPGVPGTCTPCLDRVKYQCMLLQEDTGKGTSKAATVPSQENEPEEAKHELATSKAASVRLSARAGGQSVPLQQRSVS